MKKIISVITFFIVLFGLVICSNAATPGDNEIIITNSNPGHTFTAYQIFTGDLSTDKTILTNIEWGNGVNSTELLTKLNEKSPYNTCETAEDVADVLATSGDGEVDNFAKIVGAYINTANGVTSTNDGDNYKVTLPGPGYYLIVDSLTNNLENAYSKYIVQVIGKGLEIQSKAYVPILTKTFTDGEIYNNVAVGENVGFKLTSEVPEMDGYSEYNYIITDTLTDKFSYNNDIKIKIGALELTKDTDFTVKYQDNKLVIDFTDFIGKKANATTGIEITYTAKLNTNAICGTDGNATNAVLEYSNNPNDVTGRGTTQPSYTYTYTTNLNLIKISSKDSSKLANAKFTIEKSGNVIDTLVTDSNGTDETIGISAGEYIITETEAPDGYNNLKKPIKLKITFIEPIGTDNKCTWRAEFIENVNDSTVEVDSNTGIINLTIPNLSAFTLPITGGIGTIIFYVSGIIVLIVSIYFFFNSAKSKRKIHKY